MQVSRKYAAGPVLTTLGSRNSEHVAATGRGQMKLIAALTVMACREHSSLLCRELVEADRGIRTSTMAISRYEKAMLDYGFAAVRRSAWFGNVVVSNNRLLRRAFKSALRIATRIAPLKRRMFRTSLTLP